MSTISSQEIISIIKGEIADFDAHAGEIRETGTVIWVGDGIAIVYGIDHAMYGEIVIFECGVKGMVQDIRKNEIGCILFGKDTEIVEGSRVTRTKKRAGRKRVFRACGQCPGRADRRSGTGERGGLASG